MAHSFALFVVLLLCAAPAVHAGGPAAPPAPVPDTTGAVVASSPKPLDTLWNDFKALGSDAVLLYSRPAHFGATGWVLAAGSVAGSGLASLADSTIRARFATGHNSTKDKITDWGNFYGAGIPTISISGVLYLGGLIFDAPDVRRAGLHVFQSGLYAGVITTVLKYVVGRHRPYLGDGPYSFSPFDFHDDHNSWPSGHTTLAFALGSSLAAEIGHPVATVVLYSMAVVTAASRIYHDRHWFSDTFMGACIGTAVGYGMSHLHDPAGADGGHSLLITPTLNGVALTWKF